MGLDGQYGDIAQSNTRHARMPARIDVRPSCG